VRLPPSMGRLSSCNACTGLMFAAGSRFRRGIDLKRNYHIPRNIVGAILDLMWSAQIAGGSNGKLCYGNTGSIV
jgi:hypothetical protein